MNSYISSCLVKIGIFDDSVREDTGKSENRIHNMKLKKGKANIGLRKLLDKNNIFFFENRPIASLIQDVV